MRAWMWLLLVPLAGCLGSDTPPASGEAPADFPSCQHPWPCGDEWPQNLTGPFSLSMDREPIEFVSHDGTTLRGWLTLPRVPGNPPLPAIVSASPYHGLDLAPGDGGPQTDSWGDGPVHFWAERGFAMVSVAVRGTGPSGGCFENKGPNEQLDQAHTINWVASQPWSNGRVGMIGLSYPGTTPWMAAINNPDALKTIVPIGPVTDVYTEMHSPQGAIYTVGGANEAGRRTAVTALQNHALDRLTAPDANPTELATLTQRVCPAVAKVVTEAQAGHVSDNRDAAYWQDRQLALHFADITASVFLIHGLQETAHPFQEDTVWESLSSPRRALLGQWDHETPTNDGWQDDVVAWMDFWLKGMGDVPGGLVDFETTNGSWRTSSSWPPAESRQEVLYLHPNGLQITAEPGNAAFRSAPPPPATAPHTALRHLCQDPAAAGFGVVYLSEPLASDALLAGNPFALLRLESDLQGGQIALHLYDVPDDPCQATWLSKGAADLRFHDGRMQGQDFPVSSPTAVRIDLLNVAANIPAGHRIGVVAHWGDLFATNELANPLADDRYSRSGQPYFPELIVRVGADRADGSHIVLPFLEGSLDGGEPTVEYPPRPFFVPA